MMATLRKSVWNTYRITGYTHQVGDDARATGGVHLHQVRRSRRGWQRRTVDSNGRYTSPGPVAPLADAEGEALYRQALAY
jgi:hypothetical protein